MSINAAKTGLMLVSAATSFTPRVQVQLQGETIRGVNKMKILGVTIDNDASFKSHANDVQRRLRARSWALGRLKKRGLSEEKLVQTYKCLIRPVAEYACPAWHSSITASQAAEIEKQQTIALRNIFGPGLSAAKMRVKANIDLLSKRRETAVKKFALKSINNPRSQPWFRERTRTSYPRRSGLNYPMFREETSRTDRHRNTPKNYIIRKANEA